MTNKKRYRNHRNRAGILAGLAVLVGLVVVSQTFANPTLPTNKLFDGNINACDISDPPPDSKSAEQKLAGGSFPAGGNWINVAGGYSAASDSSLTPSGTWFDWHTDSPVNVVVVKQGNGGIAYLLGSPATSGTVQSQKPDGVPSAGVSHMIFCAVGVEEQPREQPLLISKTATGAYDVQHSWTIEKLVKNTGARDVTYSDSTTLALSDGSSGSVTWKVSAINTPANTNFRLSGTIEVSNPNEGDIEGVTVSDPRATIDCLPDDEGNQSADLTIEGKGTLTCTYTVDPGTQVETNTATATWNDDESSVSDTVDVAWSKDRDIDGSAWVEDNSVIDNSSEGSPWTYDESWSCANGTAYRTGDGSKTPNTGRTNKATITWGEGNEEESSATASVTCRATPPPPAVVIQPIAKVDIQVTKTGPVAPVNIGQNITWTIVVKNNGPDTASAVTLTEQIPSGLTVVSASPSQGVCNQTTAACDIGQLLAGSSATITVVTSSGSAVGTLTNGVIVKAGNETGTKENNVASAPATVNTAPLTPPTAKPKLRKPVAKPAICAVVTIGQKSVSAGKAASVKVLATRGGKPLAGAVVRFKGAGVNKVGKTGHDGVAVVSITARKSGIITVSIVGKKTCAAQRLGVVGAFEPPVTG